MILGSWATCQHHNLKLFTFQSQFCTIYCCLFVTVLIPLFSKTYLKHSSPPMPGDCLTPLVESCTLNLFPFNSAPCNSRNRSLILPRPARKEILC